jgi:hypothetical protein
MFRFTIRDVLWLMVVVALAVGWWVDRSSLATKLEEAWSKIDQAFRSDKNGPAIDPFGPDPGK